MRPNFLGIGVQRAGTTWLAACLRSHPAIFLPEQKELAYFNGRGDRSLADYEARFDAAADEAGVTAVGEITPSYIRDADAVNRIAGTLPEARLIVVLREPVGRAYSAYELFRERWFHGRPFEDVCTPESDLVVSSRYAPQLERVLAHFDRERVGVFLYDDIERDPAGLLQRVYAFLGVDPSHAPPSRGERINRVVWPGAQRRLEAAGLGVPLELAKATPAAKWAKRAHAELGRRRDARARGRRHEKLWPLFERDVAEVEAMLDLDLTRWRPRGASTRAAA